MATRAGLAIMQVAGCDGARGDNERRPSPRARGAALCTALSLLVVFGADAADLTFAEALNVAGRQRMLSQRITKNYLQIGLDVAPEESRRHRSTAIALFDSQLAELRRFDAVAELVTRLADVDVVWQEYRPLASAEPSREQVRRLLELDEQLLAATEEVVWALEQAFGLETPALVNLCGRQRMLSQRLAKFYMALAWGFDEPAIGSQMDRAVNEFAEALARLAAAPENTLRVTEELARAKIQWGWLYSSIEFTEGAYYPLIVMDASEKLLKFMDELTGLYQDIAALAKPPG